MNKISLNIVRTHSSNPDFKYLVKLLDNYLSITDGDEHEFYNSFNSIDVIKHVVISYANAVPVACGAFKKYDNNTVEIKRMFTLKAYRGKAIATKVIRELELWAKETGYQYAILETGKRQLEAVAFYKTCSYNAIPNYGQYTGMENSLCFKKKL